MSALDFNAPKFDWSQWDKLSRVDQRKLSDAFAETVAVAPLDVQIAILKALSKSRRAPRGKVSKTASENANHQAIIDSYRRDNWCVDVAKRLTDFRREYGRRIRDDWQETRKALIIAALREVTALRENLPAPLARQLIAEKYRGLSLGLSDSEGEQVTLRVSATTLWKLEKLGAHLPGGSPEALHMDLSLCGRPKSAKGAGE
ncbi:MAG: hypothetical protein QOE26_1887 [Verrucomicrobiota bacterium]|jgi:hypothetical protein